MKKITIAILMLSISMANAQQITKEEQTKMIVHIVDSINKVNASVNKNVAKTEVNDSKFNNDSLQLAINTHQMEMDGIKEQMSPLQEQVNKMSKLKISGYMQVQYDYFDYQEVPTKDGDFQLKPGTPETSTTLTTNIISVTNSFLIRRARIKFTYQPTEGVIFVLQPNFSFSSVTLKDAYVQLNDPWVNTFQLWVGQFNRPDYEVEFSSRDRILMERSRMSGILYPQERDLGAKLQMNFGTKYNIPLNVQLAFFDGNFGEGPISNQTQDVDSQKDVVLRATYSLNFPSAGLGVDFGALGYYGKNTVFVAGNFSDVDNNTFAAAVGDKLDKQWIGTELQVYYDVLGGFDFKGECNFGTISGEANATNVLNNNPGFNFSGVRDFVGYYLQLDKNFGTKYQASVRFDSWDPNSKLSGNEVTVAPDLKVNTWSFAVDYFFTPNTKIALGYQLPINETSSTVGGIYTADVTNNVTTLRFQASF